MSVAHYAIYKEPNRPLDICHMPLPRCGPKEVLVEVSLATICPADILTVDGQRSGPRPAVLGHEGIGRVVAIGESSEPGLMGKRVTWSAADSCGECAACREWSLPQKCSRLFEYGNAEFSDGCGLNGCYASHVMLRPRTKIIPLANELPDELAVTANGALATMINATELLPSPCRVALIQGAGMLGLWGCALLRAKGVERVVVVDGDRSRLELVAAFGGHPACNTASELLEPGAADVVFEVAGTSVVVPEGVRYLRSGGHYILTGLVHPSTPLELSGQTVLRRCLTFRGVHHYAPRHLEAALEFLAEHRAKLPWERCFSPPFRLKDINSALAAARRRKWLRACLRP